MTPNVLQPSMVLKSAMSNYFCSVCFIFFAIYNMADIWTLNSIKQIKQERSCQCVFFGGFFHTIFVSFSLEVNK